MKKETEPIRSKLKISEDLLTGQNKKIQVVKDILAAGIEVDGKSLDIGDLDLALFYKDIIELALSKIQ